VPYTISDAFSIHNTSNYFNLNIFKYHVLILDYEERLIIARGMRSIRDKSCIEFVHRTTETDYVQIINGKGCFNEIGRVKGKQQVSLKKNGCVTVETAIHELMHALGFAHEHNRPDRDNYIQIITDNLEGE